MEGVIFIFGTAGECPADHSYKELWEESERPYNIFQPINRWDGSDIKDPIGFFEFGRYNQ